MDPLPLTIIVLYLAAVVAVGFAASRLVRSTSDFLLAGRKLGAPLVVAGLAATHFGGGFVLGVGEDSWTHGLSGIAFALGTGAGLIALGLVAARRLRALALYTIADYLAQRYDSQLVRGLGAALSLVAVTGILAAQVGATSGALGIIGLAPQTGAVVAVVLFVAYTFFAGIWGVTLTDALQILVIFIGLPIAAGLALAEIGGLSGLQAEVAAADDLTADSFFSPVGMGTFVVAGIIVPVVMYDLIGQDFYQRLFAARSATIARASALIAGLILLVFGIFPALAGMASRVMFPDLEDSAAAIPELVTEVMPVWAGAILVGAILAAVMSTADSLLVAGSSHVTNDFARKILGRDHGEDARETLIIARVSVAVLGLGALGLYQVMPGIVDTLVFAYTMYAGGVFVPVVGGLLWPRATAPGAVSAIAAGSLMGLLGETGLADYGDWPVIVVGGLASLLTFIVVSLATKAPDRTPSSQPVEG